MRLEDICKAGKSAGASGHESCIRDHRARLLRQGF